MCGDGFDFEKYRRNVQAQLDAEAAKRDLAKRNYTARIENARLVDGMIVGHVYDDQRRRFEDGDYIHTSDVEVVQTIAITRSGHRYLIAEQAPNERLFDGNDEGSTRQGR